MSKRQKLLERLKKKPSDFTWDELVTVMNGFGYEVRTTGGSSRKFIHSETGVIWMTHEPHPQNILKAYQIKDILSHLKREKRL